MTKCPRCLGRGTAKIREEVDWSSRGPGKIIIEKDAVCPQCRGVGWIKEVRDDRS